MGTDPQLLVKVDFTAVNIILVRLVLSVIALHDYFNLFPRKKMHEINKMVPLLTVSGKYFVKPSTFLM